jgi:hypothetical protein
VAKPNQEGPLRVTSIEKQFNAFFVETIVEEQSFLLSLLAL